MKISKIISGGQTGADYGGLKAAKAKQVLTGGVCPAGWKTEKGSNPNLADFGLVCTKSPSYQYRTRINIAKSDATIIFYRPPLDAGSKLTKKICIELKKPVFLVSTNNIEKYYDDLQLHCKAWLNAIDGNILNVAGNRESKNPGIEKFVERFLIDILDEQI